MSLVKIPISHKSASALYRIIRRGRYNSTCNPCVSVRFLTVPVPQKLSCRVGRPRCTVPPRHSEKTPQIRAKSETGPGMLMIKGMPEVVRSGAVFRILRIM